MIRYKHGLDILQCKTSKRATWDLAVPRLSAHVGGAPRLRVSAGDKVPEDFGAIGSRPRQQGEQCAAGGPVKACAHYGQELVERDFVRVRKDGVWHVSPKCVRCSCWTSWLERNARTFRTKLAVWIRVRALSEFGRPAELLDPSDLDRIKLSALESVRSWSGELGLEWLPYLTRGPVVIGNVVYENGTGFPEPTRRLARAAFRDELGVIARVSGVGEGCRDDAVERWPGQRVKVCRVCGRWAPEVSFAPIVTFSGRYRGTYCGGCRNASRATRKARRAEHFARLREQNAGGA